MKLSRTVLHTIGALLQLLDSDDGSPISSRQLATAGDIPYRLVTQSLHRLVACGVLRSVNGVKGGYILNREPDRVTLLEIVESIDGPVATSLYPIRTLDIETHVRLRAAIEEVTKITRIELQKVTLNDLSKQLVPQEVA